MRAAIASASEYRTENIEAELAARTLTFHREQRPKITPWFDLPQADAARPSQVDTHTALGKATYREPEPAGTPSAVEAAAELFSAFFAAVPDNHSSALDAGPVDISVVQPSQWMKCWHDDTTKHRPKWLAACNDPTRELLSSEDVEERTWALALWLVLGNTDRVDELLAALEQTEQPTDRPNGPGVDTPDLISWLPEEHRLAQCRKQIQTASGDPNAVIETLLAATVIDDKGIATYIFDALAEDALRDPIHRPSLIRVLLRSRLGFAADQLSNSLAAEEYRYNIAPPYQILDSTQSDLIPLSVETCEWLRERFHNAASDHQRTIALLTLAKIDHQTAVNAALGIIHSAHAVGDLTQAALAVVLTDAPQPSAQRATILLSNPIPAVRNEALRFLASPAPMRDQHSRHWKALIPTYSDYFDVLPGLSRATEPLPIEILNQMVQSDDRVVQSQAKLLLLAAEQSVDLDSLEADLREQYGEFANLCVAAALAKAGKTDAAAIRYYKDTFTGAGDDRIPAALYGVLRGLKGEAMVELRRSMRKNKGAELLQNDVQAEFSSDANLFDF